MTAFCTTRVRPEILAIIPARGGSKGIPNKNLASLGGIPLVAHSIMAAKSCSWISRVAVSTDCKRIAETAREWGAETPFMRPAYLSDDTADVGDAVNHALRWFKVEEQYEPSGFVTLFPTHPFRSHALMDLLVGKVVEGYSHVVTVRKVLAAPYRFVARDDEGRSRSLQSDGTAYPSYRRYGLFVGRTVGAWAKNNKYYCHEISTQEECTDIDTEMDLSSANRILDNRRFVPDWL